MPVAKPRGTIKRFRRKGKCRNREKIRFGRGSAIPRRVAPEGCQKFPYPPVRGRRECRAPDAPAAACANVVVESTRVRQVTPESPGIPHAMVLTASFVLSPATGLSCHRRPRTCIRKLDTSVGVSGPHDFSVRLSALRPKAHPRPPHPAPRFVTLRNAPLWNRTGRVVDLICPTPKAKYFCKTAWTDKIRKTKLICPSGGGERLVADDDGCSYKTLDV